MRTTLNIPKEVIEEAEAIYETSNKSQAVENAVRDAIRYKKLEMLKSLRGKISFDEEAMKNFRSAKRDG